MQFSLILDLALSLATLFIPLRSKTTIHIIASNRLETTQYTALSISASSTLTARFGSLVVIVVGESLL